MEVSLLHPQSDPAANAENAVREPSIVRQGNTTTLAVQPRVNAFGLRKTAHVFGAISLDEASFTFQFSDIFNGHTFHQFLDRLVDTYAPRKVFLFVDNGPCHWLDEAGKQWLAANPDKIEIHRLPPYSPEFNPTEGAWKATRKMATHNRFYRTVAERDAALSATFGQLQTHPELVSPQVARFR
jgi:hypothetical protein